MSWPVPSKFVGRMDERPAKAHRPKTSGAKVKKAKKADGKERHNPKAFSFSGGVVSVERRVRRTLDKVANRVRPPTDEKSQNENPPPLIVVVHGPPGVGKSTLIQSLVKHYTKQNLRGSTGPVTMVSGKHRRLTLVECPTDSPSMLDLAKVADLALMMIDASHGFEMETFEFLNILQNHGFPRVAGVLTHLDGFKENKTLRKAKKKLKSRFWSEIYDGARMFYLSGLINKKYSRNEIRNLARYIAVQKPSTLSFRSTHSFVLPLRVEPNGQDEIQIYGYVKGARMRTGMEVHIPGAGDFVASLIEAVDDPCPMASTREVKADSGRHLRSLKQKERLIYAPLADIGTIHVDHNAMYINLPNRKIGFTEIQGDEYSSDDDTSIARRESTSQDSTGSSSGWSSSSSVSTEDEEGAEVEKPKKEKIKKSENLPEAVRLMRELQKADGYLKGSGGEIRLTENGIVGLSSDVEGSQDEEVWARESLEKLKLDIGTIGGAVCIQRASEVFSKFVYQKSIDSTPTMFDWGRSSGMHTSNNNQKLNFLESQIDENVLPLFDDDDEKIDVDGPLGNFGTSHSLDASRLPDAWHYSALGLVVSQLDAVATLWDSDRCEALKSRRFITGGWDDGRPTEAPAPDVPLEAKIQEAEESNVFGVGTYIRMVIKNVPRNWMESREGNRTRPMIVGGLLPGESNFGYIQCRFKKHRWAPRILKTNDVLLFSVGWRRFQSLPMYSIEDRNNVRMRMLKYTPDHMHCVATFYGPITPPETGVVAIRNFTDKVNYFRISAAGLVLESSPSFAIVKKLKLIGTPQKIVKRTAFIKGMFNSDLEVAKFIACRIQTVSGIRGQIKKSVGPSGLFRASFEDRVLMSDLVLCKTWVPVCPKKFYNSILDVGEWRRLKNISELRRERQQPARYQPNSEYTSKPERPVVVFNKLVVPKKIRDNLPFRLKEKFVKEPKKFKNLAGRETAVVLSREERQRKNLVGMLTAVEAQRAEAKLGRRQANFAAKKKIWDREADARAEVTKEKRKRRLAMEGLKLKGKRRRMRMDE